MVSGLMTYEEYTIDTEDEADKGTATEGQEVEGQGVDPSEEFKSPSPVPEQKKKGKNYGVKNVEKRKGKERAIPESDGDNESVESEKVGKPARKKDTANRGSQSRKQVKSEKIVKMDEDDNNQDEKEDEEGEKRHFTDFSVGSDMDRQVKIVEWLHFNKSFFLSWLYPEELPDVPSTSKYKTKAEYYGYVVNQKLAELHKYLGYSTKGMTSKEAAQEIQEVYQYVSGPAMKGKYTEFWTTLPERVQDKPVPEIVALKYTEEFKSIRKERKKTKWITMWHDLKCNIPLESELDYLQRYEDLEAAVYEKEVQIAEGKARSKELKAHLEHIESFLKGLEGYSPYEDKGVFNRSEEEEGGENENKEAEMDVEDIISASDEVSGNKDDNNDDADEEQKDPSEEASEEGEEEE